MIQFARYLAKGKICSFILFQLDYDEQKSSLYRCHDAFDLISAIAWHFAEIEK